MEFAMKNQFLWMVVGGLKWLQILVTPSILIIGIIVCGMKSKDNVLFRGGLWFFILNLLVTILGYINNLVITPLIVQNRHSIGFLSINELSMPLILQLLSLPIFFIHTIAYILLIRGFYIKYRQIR